MAFGLPHISFIGYPVSVPCANHAGLGFREVGRADGAALLRHFSGLSAEDRRMRFCASLSEAAIGRHVAGLFARRTLVLAAFDGPLWPGPLHPAGPVRAIAELALDASEAELGISVDAALRRKGVATYLVQTAARLLAPRGIGRIRAYTLPGNRGFLTLARRMGAAVAVGPDEVEAVFAVERLHRDYRARRAAQVFFAVR